MFRAQHILHEAVTPTKDETKVGPVIREHLGHQLLNEIMKHYGTTKLRITIEWEDAPATERWHTRDGMGDGIRVYDATAYVEDLSE